MEAFEVLVSLADADRHGSYHTGPRTPPASPEASPNACLSPYAETAADACLSYAEIGAARSLVRQAHELLRFSGTPWDSPFYRDPVAFVERLTGALDRALPMALAYLDLLGGDPLGLAPAAIYERTEAERP